MVVINRFNDVEIVCESDGLTGDFPSMRLERRRLPRVMTIPGNDSELENEQTWSVSSDNSSAIV